MRPSFIMDKTLLSLLVSFLLSCSLLSAQGNEGIFSVVTNPGEDVSSQVNISWAVDTLHGGSLVVYAKACDRKWRKAVTVPAAEAFCAVFDSIYSKNAAGENYYEDARFLKCRAELRDLDPDTEYKYKIVSGDAASTEHRFKTAGARRWSACIISDFHSYPPLGGRLVAGMNMVGTVCAHDPKMDWVLHLGDVCAWGGSYSFWRTLYAEPWFERFMWAGVNGNHDNMSRKYELTSDYFRNANSNPLNGYEGQEGVCYHFRYGDALFIMLNNEEMRSDEGLAAAREWVCKVLEENADARYKVVCEHYQWFFGNDGRASQYKRWKDVFDRYGVDLALAGNNHIYVRTGALYQDMETDGSVGTVYLQTPSSDNERGQAADDPISENVDWIKCRWTEGGRTVGALHLDVTPKRMVVTLLDREGRTVDSTVIKAKR